MPNIGPLELIIILLVVLLLFGAKRLPELGRSLGSGMREFKDGVTGSNDSETGSNDSEPERTALEPGEQPASTSTTTPAETPVEAEPRS